MLAPNPTDAAAEAVALVERLRADRAQATAAFEAARQQRAAIDEADVDRVVLGDEAVRSAHRARGIAQDRLDLALAQLARRREVPA